MKIKLPAGLKCVRCGHKWIPRKDKIAACPKCRSPYWNIKRKGKK